MREIRRNPHVIWDQLDGVPSFCHTETVKFFRMNAVGNFIWEICDGITIDEIVKRLSAIYPDENPEGLKHKISRFILQLEEFGLIESQDT